ncbi:MAG: hypothetical protein HN764_15270 [Gammaproteobacteria bacterium]|nr:hypothetical protein [Gammaproteobacteria bacterium]
MINSPDHQRGFGMDYLVPVLATFSICIYLLLPAMQSLFTNTGMLLAIGLCLIPIVGTIWLSSQCFGDYLNFGIVIIFAVCWSLGGTWMLDMFREMDINLLAKEGMLTISILSIYIYLHAIILSLVNLLQKHRDGLTQG